MSGPLSPIRTHFPLASECSTAEESLQQWTRDLEFERALMRSPLAAELAVVEHRIALMMFRQGVSRPSELTAGSAGISTMFDGAAFELDPR